MPNLILKKPSELQKPIPVHYIYDDGIGIGCYCPNCGLEHNFINDWPIDIPILCSNTKQCKCRFIITNDTPIED